MITQARMGTPERIPWSGCNLVVFSTPAPGREHNEDGCLVMVGPLGGRIFAVADGAGGTPDGDRASAEALSALAAAIADDGAAASLRERVLRGFDAANDAVLALRSGAATTLAVATVEDGDVRTYHAGDSSVVVMGQRGKVKLETLSHSPSSYAVEAGLLEPAEAVHHEEHNVISNWVGSPDMRVELGPPVRLAPYDTLLVGSDGLFDNLHRETIVRMLRAGPLVRAATVLARACRAHMTPDEASKPEAVDSLDDPLPPPKPDDLTFVAFRLAGS